MATKTTATKKKTTTKSTAKTTSKAAPKTAAKTTVKKAAAPKRPSVSLVKETYPEDHVITGKYKFFYGLFALTTIVFAVLTVWLYIFSVDIMNDYESIKVCARNHQYSYCVNQAYGNNNTATETTPVEGAETDVTTEE